MVLDVFANMSIPMFSFSDGVFRVFVVMSCILEHFCVFLYLYILLSFVVILHLTRCIIFKIQFLVCCSQYVH